MSFGRFYVDSFGRGRRAWLAETAKIDSVADVPRGYVTVTEDGLTRIYRVSPRDRKAFKAWARAVYSGMNCKRIAGRWPHYDVRGRA